MSNSIDSVGPILCCNALRQRPQQTENQFQPQHLKESHSVMKNTSLLCLFDLLSSDKISVGSDFGLKKKVIQFEKDSIEIVTLTASCVNLSIE